MRTATTTAIRPARRRLSRRFNLLRIVIVLAIVITALGAFVLHIGVFRFLFRGILVVGAIALFGSYFWGLWFKWAKRRN